MRVRWKRVVPVLAVAGLLLIPSSIATAVSVDGTIGDWGVNTSTVNGIYSAANPIYSDISVFDSNIGDSWVGDGYDGYYGRLRAGETPPPPPPGYGGQNFDIEAMYAYYGAGGDGRGLYVAVVTGFDPGGVWDWSGGPPQFRLGDIFLRFGSGTGWNAAVETSGLTNTQNDPQPWAEGGTPGAVYTGSGTWWTMGCQTYGFPTYGPAEIVHDGTGTGGSGLTVASPVDNEDAQPFIYTDVVRNGNAYVEMSTTGIAGQYDNNPPLTHPYAQGYGNQYDHNVIEVFLSDSLLISLGMTAGDSITVSSWMSEQCANDMGQVATLVTPVPEPVSMLMLGCLGAGMLGARKVRRWRKTEK